MTPSRGCCGSKGSSDMSRTRTLTQLILDVRSRADQDTSNGAIAYIADSVIAEWLNQAWADLYDHLVKAGEHYYLKTDTFVTANAVDVYALPADHYKTMGVSVQASGYWQPAHRFQMERRDDYSQFGPVWVWPFDLHYDLWGQNLKFLEMPNGGYNVRHLYYPVAARMNPADPNNASIDGVNGWELYCVDWAARKCATRDENADLAALLGQDIASTLQRIVSMSSTRNPGEAPRARVVRGNGRRVRLPYPRNGGPHG